MTLAEIVDAIDSYKRNLFYCDASVAVLDAIGIGARTEDSADAVARRLLDVIANLQEDLAEVREDYAKLEASTSTATDDIEQGYRFGQPDLIREAYRTLTGHLLHA